MFENRKISPAKALLGTIRESDAIAVIRSIRGMTNDPNPSAIRQDLRPFWNDNVDLLFAGQFRLSSESRCDER